jgi:hypothetical protein
LLVKGFGSGTIGFVGRGRKACDVYGDYAVTMPSLSMVLALGLWASGGK